MPDGSKITIRIKTSSKDSPAVDLKLEGFHDDVNAVYPDSHVTTVRILPEIDKLYCYYFIKNKQAYLETMGEGSTNQKELKPDTISSLYFPLPPYSEQHRIVTKIEEIFKKLDEILQNLSV